MRIERALDRCCPQGANPLSHLGAIACLMFALLLLSGIYLYVFFDTSVGGAWASVERLSAQPPGSWLRSLHRYAADLFLLSVWLHLLREAVLGRYTRFRRLSWLTGLVLLPLVYLSGVGGFWLAWDQLGQYSAIASAELLDALPLFPTSLSRNFLTPEAVNDRLFSLLIFVHLGVPLLMLFALWFHLQRITRPQLWPPRALALALLSCLGVLALARPILSLPPADLGSVPAALPLDWWLLHWLPLAEAWGPALTWAVMGAMLLLLLLLPLRSQAPPPVAVVDADNCNGCQRCVADCPYAAITLEPHPNGKAGRQIAVVAADRCASCGICAGSCPSATPFRSTELLVSGIDMPQQTIAALRRQLETALADHTEPAIVVYGCEHGADLGRVTAPGLIALSLLCIGQMPPAFVEYALRAGAAGVLIVGCPSGGCAFRWGEALTAQRLNGQREPHLRANVPKTRWQMLQAGAGEEARVSAAALQLLRRLRLPPQGRQHAGDLPA